MRKKTIYTGLLLGVLALLLLFPDVAMAADDFGDILGGSGGSDSSVTPKVFSETVIDFGKDINEGTSFRTEFQKIFLGMNTVFKSIITILTIAAASMVVFGIEDGKKTVWQFMLGIGLAYMFIARIEFYTMLMLSIVFLPFGVTERLAFLCNSAISLMFNSGAKMMVICFLQVMMAKTISAYLSKLTVSPFAPEQFSVMCQIMIMCVFFAYITKKIPELVSSFLNGSPALSGGGMISQAKGMATQTAMVLGTAAGAVAGAGAASTAAKAAHAASGKPTTMMSQLKNSTAGMMVRGMAQNAMARNPLTQGYASGMKSMVGGDGSLQNEGFMKGVRQLAGLEADKDAPKPTKSIRDLATDPTHNQANYDKKTDKNDDTPPPSGPPPGGSPPAQPKGDDTQNKKDDSKSGGVAVNVNGNNSVERSAPVTPQSTMGKDKEKTVEKEFRSESQHTASKEQTATPGQNLATMGDKGTGGSGGSNNISNVQQTRTETKNQQTTNNQQTKNVQGGNGAGGKQPDGSMSQLNNYKK